MNLFQLGLLFSLPVHTYLPVKQVIDRFFERKLIFLCRVLSFIFYWFGMVRRKLTIPEKLTYLYDIFFNNSKLF